MSGARNADERGEVVSHSAAMSSPFFFLSMDCPACQRRGKHVESAVLNLTGDCIAYDTSASSECSCGGVAVKN